MKLDTCPLCCGIGKVPNQQDFGRLMRKLREQSKLSLREVARRLGYSASYVSDLELGRRKWDMVREQKYRKALKASV